MTSSLRTLRVATMLEGVSLLVLVAIAMPLKYAAGMPMATRVVGTLHGLLFVIFVVALYRAVVEQGWRWPRWLRIFLAAVVPGGFLLVLRGENGIDG